MTFITTHIDFDGGAEGHWEATRRVLHRHIEGEHEFREFLSIVRLAQSSQLGAFSSIVERPDIFAALPGASKDHVSRPLKPSTPDHGRQV